MSIKLNFNEELKKMILAGVGATAVTMEKAEEIVNYCVEKGELTVEQGKVMNEELKRNVKDEWWRAMLRERDDIVALDSAILQSPKVWEASGHLRGFTDPLVDCRTCGQRFRAYHLDQGFEALHRAARELVQPATGVQHDRVDRASESLNVASQVVGERRGHLLRRTERGNLVDVSADTVSALVEQNVRATDRVGTENRHQRDLALFFAQD